VSWVMVIAFDWSGVVEQMWALVPVLVGGLLGVLVLMLIGLVRAGVRLIRFRLLREWARQLVRWAAQKLPEDVSSSTRFRRVMTRLRKAFPGAPQEELEAAVEEAVLELKQGLESI